MSTNIQVRRICQHCGQEFTARTTVTQYCGDLCAKRAYKQRAKAAKIQESDRQTRAILTGPIEQLKAKEFLTVREASHLIGCSRQAVYNLIHAGRLKATNLMTKKTIIRRPDLDNLFQ